MVAGLAQNLVRLVRQIRLRVGGELFSLSEVSRLRCLVTCPRAETLEAARLGPAVPAVVASQEKRRVQLSEKMRDLLQVSTRRILYKLPGHQGSVNAVDFHPTEPIREFYSLHLSFLDRCSLGP